MDKLLIRGGRALQGTVQISGAKNAALPLMAASLLCPASSAGLTLHNVPHLADIRTMEKLLRNIGIEVTRQEHTCHMQMAAQPNLEAPYDLVKTMRASVLVLGPMLSHFGQAKVSLPGGCAIGQRPVDQHIKGLRPFFADP